MKTRVFALRYWCVPTSGHREPFIVHEALTEIHIRGLAEYSPHLIFFEELIDLGLFFDDDLRRFEIDG